jgi:intein/homing endonuclease
VDGMYINTYNSIIEASMNTNTSSRHISNVCKGKRKTSGGFIWKYYEMNNNQIIDEQNIEGIKIENFPNYILTKEGQIPIKDYVDKNVTVWNGSEWSEVTVKKTGVNQELVRVSLSNGTHIDCTPEHKFYIQESYSKTGTKELAAKDLQQENKLIKYNNRYIKMLNIISGDWIRLD